MKIETSCPRDVSIDCNVLEHSSNTGVPQFESSVRVMMWVAESEKLLWVLDDQGKVAPDPSTSVLYSEYNRRLAPQSLAQATLVKYLQTGRVVFSRRPDSTTLNRLRKLVPKNKPDQAVLGAAIGALDKVLISNDWQDFTLSVRSEAEDTFGVTIMDSDEAVA